MKTEIEILEGKAIDAAMKGKWREAIDLNEQIVKKDPQNTETYLRLGFAYFQINHFSKAKKHYQKALRFNPANQIARLNLEKIKILEKKGGAMKGSKNNRVTFSPDLFLNVLGKTKVVPLINIGQISVLAKLKIGEKVFLKIKKRRVEVRNEKGEYIGAFPDDISRRLIFFIEAKSQYATYIKEVSKNNVDVFIREEKKGKKVKNYTSFPKNIQDDLKAMASEENGSEEGEKEEPTVEEDHKDVPLDLEKLAEELSEKEDYPEGQFDEEKDDLEE